MPFVGQRVIATVVNNVYGRQDHRVHAKKHLGLWHICRNMAIITSHLNYNDLGWVGAGLGSPPRSLHVPSTSQEIKQILGVTWNTDDSDRGR